MKRRAVLLDRDGTLIKDRKYLAHPDGVELYKSAAAALRGLRRAGFLLIVVTNQSGVGRGMFSRRDVEAVHGRLSALLRKEGVRLDGILTCYHAPSDRCRCRKPAPGMALTAARRWNLDLRASVVVGDKSADVELARAIGARSVLVRTGAGRRSRAKADHTARDLGGAARWILGRP